MSFLVTGAQITDISSPRKKSSMLLETLSSALRSAENHRAIVEQFGRFPYRNRVLGRTSTAQENEWLRRGGASFGQ